MRQSYNTLRKLTKVDAFNEIIVRFPSDKKLKQLGKLFELTSGVIIHGFSFLVHILKVPEIFTGKIEKLNKKSLT